MHESEKAEIVPQKFVAKIKSSGGAIYLDGASQVKSMTPAVIRTPTMVKPQAANMRQALASARLFLVLA
jgi:hypothetical protein